MIGSMYVASVARRAAQTAADDVDARRMKIMNETISTLLTPSILIGFAPVLVDMVWDLLAMKENGR